MGYAADTVRQKFTGKSRDIESELDYFEARYYNSKHGRFTSPDEFKGGPEELFGEVDPHDPLFYADTAEPQSLNKYHYALNNPLRYVDPDGHQTIVADALKLATPAIIVNPELAIPIAIGIGLGAMTSCPCPESYSDPFSNAKIGDPNALRMPVVPVVPQVQPKVQPQAQPQTEPPQNNPNKKPQPRFAPPSPELAKGKPHKGKPSKRTNDKHTDGEARKDKGQGVNPDGSQSPDRIPRKRHDQHVGPWPPQPAVPGEPSRNNPCPTCKPTWPRIEPKPN